MVQGGSFITSTRQKRNTLGQQSKPTGGGQVTFDLPKAGILQAIYLNINATITGTLSAPNANGLASIIRRVTLRVNSGNTLFDFSGAGYHWLIRDAMGLNRDPLSWTNARAAVTAVANQRLDMIIPVSLNNREETGLFMLQNEGTLATLIVDFETDSVVATGATVVATVKPTLVTYEVPSNEANWPDMSMIHQWLEENVNIAASGQLDHQIARGAILLGQYYLVGTTTYSNAEFRVQQSNVIEGLLEPPDWRLRFAELTERDQALSGVAITDPMTTTGKRLFLDFLASDGLGDYGSVRDVLDTRALTSIFTRFTFAGAGNLLSLRRQLLPLAG